MKSLENLPSLNENPFLHFHSVSMCCFGSQLIFRRKETLPLFHSVLLWWNPMFFLGSQTNVNFCTRTQNQCENSPGCCGIRLKKRDSRSRYSPLRSCLNSWRYSFHKWRRSALIDFNPSRSFAFSAVSRASCCALISPRVAERPDVSYP